MSGITIRNALIFDGSSELVEHSLRLESGVVVERGPRVSDAEKIVDARGRVVTAGLIDAHFHAYATDLHLAPIERSPLSYLALVAGRRLTAALHRGFTTVRDVAGGDPGLARAIRTGMVVSPRYLYTGAALSQTGGHGDWRESSVDACAHDGHMSEVVDGVDDLRRAVRTRFRDGAHAIKIMTSGGVVSPSDPIRNPQYSADEIRAVVDEATRRGSYVAAHAYSPEAIRHSVENGVRSIEHGNLLDARTARVMADHDSVLVPTLAAYAAMARFGEGLGLPAVAQAKNREVLEAGQYAIQFAYDAGVTVGFGSDLMGDLGVHQLLGVRLQGEATDAMSTMRALTMGNATVIGDVSLVRLHVGDPADLVLWDRDPLTNLSAVWDESAGRTVVRAGEVVNTSIGYR